jgi:hypothetical protein
MISEILFISAAIHQADLRRKAIIFEAFSAAQSDIKGRQEFVDQLIKSSWS